MARRKIVEQRILPLDVEYRVGDGEAPGTLTGHAAVFNQWATISEWWGDMFQEQMAPGAFKKTLKEGDIRALWNHDPNIVLGRVKAGTLELREDETGLSTTISPPDNEWGRPVLDAVKRGDVSGMSIAFQVIKDEWTTPDRKKEPTAMRKRVIKEARLFDVSPVTFPAYPQTDISARDEAGDSDSRLADAFRAARLAEIGLPLEVEERAAIRAVAEFMTSAAREPEAQVDHSTEAQRDEPVVADHSEATRARTLELMKKQMEASL